MEDKNEFLVWLEKFVVSLESADVPDYSKFSGFNRGVKKGEYEERMFIARALRHRLNAEYKRIEEENKFRKEMEANGELGD